MNSAHNSQSWRGNFFDAQNIGFSLTSNMPFNFDADTDYDQIQDFLKQTWIF